MEEACYLGVDIGGTDTKLGLVSAEGCLLKRFSFRSDDFTSSHEYVLNLSAEIKTIIEHERVLGIGLGAPTANYQTGFIEDSVNLKWSQPLDIRSNLEMLLNIPVFVTNDANLAALGELRYGLGRTFVDLLVVTIGTGLGSGIIADGRLINGNKGLAGEIGHVILIPGGRKCSCGRNGCLESYVSIGGLQKTYQEIKESSETISTEEIYKQAIAGGVDSLDAIKMTGSWLGIGLANASAVVAPQCIVLSGGLANMGETLLDPTKQAFEEHLLNNLKGEIEMKISAFENNESSLIGAAAFAMEELKSLKTLSEHK